MALAAAPAGRTPVVVELFTSEGCSSCPAADEALSRLAAQQPIAEAWVIPLSLHVDYWNSIGWADPFSAAEFSARQEAYSQVLGGGVYTPEAVVDGIRALVGSSPALVAAIRDRARRERRRAALTVALALEPGADTVRIRLGDASLPARADILFGLAQKQAVSHVARGENAGRTLTHTYVVRRLVRVGEASPGARFDMPLREIPLTIDLAPNESGTVAIVLVQERSSREIVAADMIDLPENATTARGR